MRRADRLLQIIQILRRERAPVSGGAIAGELEVSLRTVYRDMVALEASGVPIRGEAGVGYVLEAGFDLPPLMFSTDELEAVMLGLRMVEGRGDAVLSRAARDTVAKIAAVLPGSLKDEFIEVPLFAPVYEPFPREHIELPELRAALRAGQVVEITYQVPGRPAERRSIWPCVLGFFQQSRVLGAWCELRQDFRNFRTDRILDMTVTERMIPKPRRQLFAEWRRHQQAEMERCEAEQAIVGGQA
ncbi:YafY family transcriptional regulator [Stappia sp. F7233]|uniref:YafY family transcriptional regulator n=1 Tax=Stappia albiluteola TaxID=2758565 RepID=A0A839ABZ4_9HYPH|nr:YafY family protein [Stappia albiluteola]MBA5776686.1 YafY family transcriptional regulator [Stappia albiluteola]